MAGRYVGDRCGLVDQRGGSSEVALKHKQSGALVQCDWQHTERAGVAGEPDVPGQEQIPALGRPTAARRWAGRPSQRSASSAEMSSLERRSAPA